MKALLAIVGVAAATGCGSLAPTCTDTTQGKVCLPEKAKPDVALTFHGGGFCANTCGSSDITCTVARDGGGRFLVTLSEHACVDTGAACPDLCRIADATCTFPALAAGDYEVIVNGGGTQRLVVADGGETSCVLANP